MEFGGLGVVVGDFVGGLVENEGDEGFEDLAQFFGGLGDSEGYGGGGAEVWGSI